MVIYVNSCGMISTMRPRPRRRVQATPTPTASRGLIPAGETQGGIVLQEPSPRALASILENFQYLYGVWLQSLSENTRRAYQRDLRTLLDWRECPGEKAFAETLSGMHGSEANIMALEWQNELVSRKLSPASINRTMSAFKSFVKLLRMNGLVTWTIEIPKRRAQAYKDTKGCGTAAVIEVITRLSAEESPAAIRDEAVIRLLWGLGLRRGEIARLDLSDVDFKARKLTILGKGRHEPEKLDLPDKVAGAIKRWLQHRGTKPGALFWNFRRSGDAKRLSGQGVWLITKRHGLGRPHGVRHASITEALEKWDTRGARRFSRHKDFNTLMIYDDRRQDSARKISEALEEDI